VQRQSKKKGTILKRGGGVGRIQGQRDLGVFVYESVNVTGQVGGAVNKANTILGFMNRGTEYRAIMTWDCSV